MQCCLAGRVLWLSLGASQCRARRRATLLLPTSKHGTLVRHCVPPVQCGAGGWYNVAVSAAAATARRLTDWPTEIAVGSLATDIAPPPPLPPPSCCASVYCRRDTGTCSAHEGPRNLAASPPSALRVQCTLRSRLLQTDRLFVGCFKWIELYVIAPHDFDAFCPGEPFQYIQLYIQLGLTPRIPRTVYRYFWAYPFFYSLVSLFSHFVTFWFRSVTYKADSCQLLSAR